MRKKIAAVIISGVMITGIFTGRDVQDISADQNRVTLSVMCSQDWLYDAEMELGKKFEEETGIQIDYQIVPADQYYNLLMTKLNSGEGPDIFGGQSGSEDLLSQYNITENAVDLSDQPWVKNYDPLVKEQTSVDGKVYGATYYDTSTDYYVIYNKKIFEENNLMVPDTFTEFQNICEKLLAQGITPIYEPCADGWHETMWFCEIGGRYEQLVDGIVEDLNNNTRKFADIPELETALDQINLLAQKGYFGSTYLTDEYAELAKKLGSGQYAMTLEKPGKIASIAENSDGKYKQEDFGMFLIPILDNDVLNEHPCGPARFIYSKSEHIDEAKKYLEYLTGENSVQYMIDHCHKIENLPYHVGQTPAYSAETEKFLDSCEKQGTVFQDSIKYLNPQWSELTEDLFSMFVGEMTSRQVLEAIDKRREVQAIGAGDSCWN